MDNRYLSQTSLPEITNLGQSKLEDSKVLVIGCGGLGSIVLPYLVAAGVGKITIMDDDVVNLTNLNRQILFKESDIGCNKAIVLKRELEKQNPSIKITALIEKFNLNNGLLLCKLHDIVLDCTDIYTSKLIINYCCIQNNTPLVFASVLGWDGQVSLLSMNGNNYPCYKCWQEFAPQNIGNCTLSGVLGTSVSLIGSYQAQLTLQYLLGYQHNVNYLFVFDLWNLQNKKLKLQRRHNCKFHNQNITSLKYISYSKLKTLEKYCLIDVRSKLEYEQGQIPKAINILPSTLLNSNQYNLIDNLVIYCNQESLSTLVVENLQNLGYNAFVLKGGYSAYTNEINQIKKN